MMKYRIVIIFSAIIISILPHLLHAHGVNGTVDKGGIVVTAQYDSGEPMSYAKVKISAPGARLTFQSGRTDRNGRFCFFADAVADWEVVVDDDMGHSLKVMVPVNEAMELKTGEQARGRDEGSLSTYEKTLMGISIIFGFSGIFF